MFQKTSLAFYCLELISGRRRGLIFAGANNRLYFFGLQVDGPVTGGGGLYPGGGGLITGCIVLFTGKWACNWGNLLVGAGGGLYPGGAYKGMSFFVCTR